MRQLLAIVTLSLFLVAPFQGAAAATPTYTNLEATGGDNWASMTLSSPVECVDLRLFFEFDQSRFMTSFMAAFWFRGPGEWLSGFIWTEGASLRVSAYSSITGPVLIGSTPTVAYGATTYQYPPPGSPDIQMCAIFADGWTNIAFAVPDADSSTLRLASDGPLPVASTSSGGDAFAADARDFTGTYAEAEAYVVGASAVVDKSLTATVPDGMIAFFTATTASGILDVTGPNGFYRSAYCSGGNVFVGVTCAQTTAASFAHVGDGTAPAGDYTFRYTYGTAAEAVHLFLVAAPVDW